LLSFRNGEIKVHAPILDLKYKLLYSISYSQRLVPRRRPSISLAVGPNSSTSLATIPYSPAPSSQSSSSSTSSSTSASSIIKPPKRSFFFFFFPGRSSSSSSSSSYS